MSKVQFSPEKDSTIELEQLSEKIKLVESCQLEDSKLMHATDLRHITTEEATSDSEEEFFQAQQRKVETFG